jgi:hypothetical protein
VDPLSSEEAVKPVGSWIERRAEQQWAPVQWLRNCVCFLSLICAQQMGLVSHRLRSRPALLRALPEPPLQLAPLPVLAIPAPSLSLLPPLCRAGGETLSPSGEQRSPGPFLAEAGVVQHAL